MLVTAKLQLVQIEGFHFLEIERFLHRQFSRIHIGFEQKQIFLQLPLPVFGHQDDLFHQHLFEVMRFRQEYHCPGFLVFSSATVLS